MCAVMEISANSSNLLRVSNFSMDKNCSTSAWDRSTSVALGVQNSENRSADDVERFLFMVQFDQSGKLEDMPDFQLDS